MCVAKPPDPTYEPAVRRATAFLLEKAKTETFSTKELVHKRGGFPVINAGIVGGQGSPEPHNLKNAGHEETIADILANKDIQRMAAHQSGE